MKRFSFFFTVFYLLLFLSGFTFFSQQAEAGDIIINEFALSPSQWVEIYNKGGSEINISGWFIDDSGGSQKYTIPDNTTLAPSEFKVFESNIFNFNTASSDVAQLLNGSSVEDSYSYSNAPNGASYGRQSDGGTDWVAFATETKGSSNNSATAVPTSTPTPSIIPTSTNAPTPTKTPTPAPSPTNKPGATNTPIPATTKIPSPTLKNSVTPTVISTKSPTIWTTKAVLAANISISPTTVINNQQGNVLPGILIVFGGVILITCGILLVFQKDEFSKLFDIWKKQ